MKDYEKVIKGLKVCTTDVPCEECPYNGGMGGCTELRKEALELLEEMKAQLEQPASCNYEAECRRLNDELCRVNVEYERTQRELAEAQKELAYLRAVKATAEAFLGVKIDGQM